MPACLSAHGSCLREFRSWLFVTTPALSLSIYPVNEWSSLSKCEPGVKTHRAQSLLEIREGTFRTAATRPLLLFAARKPRQLLLFCLLHTWRPATCVIHFLHASFSFLMWAPNNSQTSPKMQNSAWTFPSFCVHCMEETMIWIFSPSWWVHCLLFGSSCQGRDQFGRDSSTASEAIFPIYISQNI